MTRDSKAMMMIQSPQVDGFMCGYLKSRLTKRLKTTCPGQVKRIPFRRMVHVGAGWREGNYKEREKKRVRDWTGHECEMTIWKKQVLNS